MLGFDTEIFIKKIIKRNESMFQNDLLNHSEKIEREIYNKSVLVIGGAGTIGSSFIKQILNYKPANLFVFDLNENGLTELIRDIRSSNDIYIPGELRTFPVDFGSDTFFKILKGFGRFDIVANFAALKHVRTEKDQYCSQYMIDNNVLKAKKLLDYLGKNPPEHFFCVSTDKAANPVNIMGASKKLMEELILSYSDEFKISTARFANVAFSNGSLLDGFIKRIEKKQPLSSPNNIRRYFVSPEEAGQLCLISCILGRTGEIFVPIMNPETDMIKFSDIAVDLLNSIGFIPELCNTEEEAIMKSGNHISRNYPCYFFESDTSGEKEYEEFWTEDEQVDLSVFEKIGIVKYPYKIEKDYLQYIIYELKELFAQDEFTKEDIVELLQEHIFTFKHLEKGKTLDQRM